MRLFVALLLLLVAMPVAALERPVPRPTLASVERVVAIRPVPRPGGPVSGVEVVDRIEAALIAQSALSVLSSTAGRDLGVEVASRAVVSDAVPRGQDPSLVLPAPKVRPDGLVEVMSSRGAVSVPELPAVRRSMRPMPRVAEADRVARLVAAAIAAPDPIVGIDGALRQSARPEIRPAIRLAAGRRLREGRGGGLCGRASIQGETIAAVPGRGACGIPQAVRITQVSGVALSRGSRMDCGTAQALDDWVRTGVIPTVGGRGGGVTRLEVAAGYACRTRNSLPGARISEHGKGRAIDISGIKLANGEVISVLRDWGKGAKGRILASLWRAACGPFGTVLGPNSDRFHRDHFHFDTARYRSGSYCR